jgi:NAD(P)-dependent dehydrogenase (short-subunit alcohol dehydrogenase family)
MMNVGQKIALVTGAGSGIGRASAIALAEAGYAVALAGRRLAALEKTASMISGRSLPVQADVSRPESVDALFAAIRDEFGRLDVLFNNAGLNAPGVPIEEMPYETFRSVIEVNVIGAFLCAQAAFRLMKEQTPRGGRIINNGSIAAFAPRPNHVPYTASKHAMTGITKCFALDGRKYDIACSQIDIGNAATEMTDRIEKGVMQADGTLKVEARMDVRHVAAMVVHIANLPLDANILYTTVMATKMPLVGRG